MNDDIITVGLTNISDYVAAIVMAVLVTESSIYSLSFIYGTVCGHQ